MIISYIKNILINTKKNNNNIIFLNNISKRLIYIINSISKINIDIIETNDINGGYYNNKFILPTKISYFKSKRKNLYLYIYKCIVFLYLSKINIKNNDKDPLHLLLALYLKLKIIIKNIRNDLPNFIFIEKMIYPFFYIDLKKIENRKCLLLKIIFEKLIYKKIDKKYILKQNEILLIYKIENFIKKNLKNNLYILTLIYKELYSINCNYEDMILFHLWGYEYYSYLNKSEKFKIKKKNIKQIVKKNINIKIKNVKYKNKIIKENTLNSLFNYNKTIDKFNKNNNKNINNDIKDEVDNLNDNNLENSFKTNIEVKYILKNNIIKNNSISLYDKEIFNIYEYNEWDFNLNDYKKNWCKIFEEKTKNKSFLENNDDFSILTKKYKNKITFLKNKLINIINNKKWYNKNKNGEDFDFDEIINNYKEIIFFNFDKIYKYKKKFDYDYTFSLLLDNSFSVDSYINNIKKIDFIKTLTIIIALTLDKIIPYDISSFYSNTRHDCRYNILKEITDKIDNVNQNILNLKSNGYTRIGPAIRHTINNISKHKSKKKIILLFSDGNPTDYDEYEGLYGFNDIKMAIIEGLKKRIIIKSVLINNNSSNCFIKLFGTQNCITMNDLSYKNLLKIFSDLN